jgi:hypothetical protein
MVDRRCVGYVRRVNHDEAVLSNSDLIPDRSLRPGDRDRFAHDDFVERLVTVIREVPTPANVALFGAWGSGKSGIALRLRARCNQDPTLAFAEFNALKYARSPLLRQFIVEVGRQTLDTKAAEGLRESLYKHTNTANLKVGGEIARVLKWFGWAILGLVFAVAVLLAVLQGRAHDVMLDIVRGILPAAVPAALILAIVTRVLPYLTVTTKRDAPNSEEEFEEIFKTLVHKQLGITGAPRKLVVFVDELDRCSPKEVVATLESLRTFLGVSGCVFIVAADQRALEHALTLEVRQATPRNIANPYYSAGSAYLDKIFEYQLALPPLLPTRLVDFALQLARERGGVWTEIEDLDEVLSVLIPVHVQSPRRVKVLLNRYALTYRLAVVRAQAGKLQSDVQSRSAELAKLVCLRTEFPLFAADLDANWRLAEMVTRCRDILDSGGRPTDDNELSGVDPELLLRAVAYASGRLPVDQLLSDTSVYATTDEERDDHDEEHVEDQEPGNGDSDPGSVGVGLVQQSHAVQLLNYLQKTRGITGPGRDLIHLEGTGSVLRVPPDIAQRIEIDALNNRPDRVAAAVEGLSDPNEQAQALLVLAELLRASRGNDADNVVTALLRAATTVAAPIDGVADKLVGFVAEYAGRRNLDDDDLAGALALAIAGGDLQLTTNLLDHPLVRTRSDLRDVVLQGAPTLLPQHSDAVAAAAATQIIESPDEAAERLTKLPLQQAVEVIRAARDRIAAALAVTSAAAKSGDAAPEVTERHSQTLTAVRRVIDDVPHELGEALLPALLGGSERLAWDAQLEAMDGLAPIADPDVVRRCLTDMARWTLGAWPRIVNALTMDALSVSADEVDQIVAGFWDKAVAGQDKARPALDAVRELAGHGAGSSRTKADGAVDTTLAGPLANDDEVAAREELLDIAGVLADLDYLTWERLATGALTELRALLAELPTTVVAGAARQAVDETVATRHAILVVAVAAHHVQHEALLETIEAIRASPWIGTPVRERLLLEILAVLPRDQRPDVGLGPDEIATLAGRYDNDFTPGLAAWIRALMTDPADVRTVLAPYRRRSVPGLVKEALAALMEGMSASQLASISAPVVRDAHRARPSIDYLRALGIQDADEAAVSAELLASAKEASSVDEREAVLQAWEALDPHEDIVRRRLIREVFLRFADENASTFRMAVKHLKLCVPAPYGTKGEIVTRLEGAAPKGDDKSLERRLQQFALKPRPRRWRDRIGL